MRVVHCYLAHPEHPSQSTGKFVPVEPADFGKAQRQVAVASYFGVINISGFRAIHRFYGQYFVFINGICEPEHIVAVMFPMAAFLKNILFYDYRSGNFVITFAVIDGTGVLFKFFENYHSFRMPKRCSRRDLVETEKVHYLPEFAMVSMFIFLLVSDHGLMLAFY